MNIKSRLSAVVVVLLTGCSTVTSKLEDDEGAHNWGTPYSGVRYNAEHMKCFGIATLIFPPVGLIGLAILVVDFPVSLIADTLVLPLDLAKGEPERQKSLYCNFHI